MAFLSNLFTGAICLGIIIVTIIIICKQYTEHQSSNHPVIQTLKQHILRCFPDLDYIKLYEGCKSYTINKEKIYLCIRDKNGDYYQHDILMHVLLHEIAHVLCTDVGHTQQFRQIFDSMIMKAIDCGIYRPVTIPKDYCSFE